MMDCSNPKEILILLINEYCNKYCDLNIWCLERIHNLASMIDNATKTEIKFAKHNIKALIALINVLEEKQYNINIVVDLESINDLRHVLLTDNTNLNIKEVLTDYGIELFSLLEAAIMRLQTSNAILILKGILALPANKIIKAGNYIITVVFDFLFSLSNDKVHDYIGYARDIFLYKLKKTDKQTRQDRMPLLFNCLLACIQRRVLCQQIDYIKKEESITLNKFNYMYLLPVTDNDIVEKIRQLKTTKSYEHRYKMAMKIDVSGCKDFDKLESSKNKINIIRIKNATF